MTTTPRIDVKVDFFLTVNLTIEPPIQQEGGISNQQGLFQQFKT